MRLNQANSRASCFANSITSKCVRWTCCAPTREGGPRPELEGTVDESRDQYCITRSAQEGAMEMLDSSIKLVELQCNDDKPSRRQQSQAWREVALQSRDMPSTATLK